MLLCCKKIAAPLVGAPFVGPLFCRTSWTCLNPPLSTVLLNALQFWSIIAKCTKHKHSFFPGWGGTQPRNAEALAIFLDNVSTVCLLAFLMLGLAQNMLTLKSKTRTAYVARTSAYFSFWQQFKYETPKLHVNTMHVLCYGFAKQNCHITIILFEY